MKSKNFSNKIKIKRSLTYLIAITRKLVYNCASKINIQYGSKLTNANKNTHKNRKLAKTKLIKVKFKIRRKK